MTLIDAVAGEASARSISGAFSWTHARVVVDDAANVLGLRVLYFTILSIGAGMQGRTALAVHYQVRLVDTLPY